MLCPDDEANEHASLARDHWAKGEHDEALSHARRCVERAEARQDRGLRVTGLFYGTQALQALGRFAEAARAASQVRELLDGGGMTERSGLAGLPCADAGAIGAECLAELGDHHGALALIADARRAANAADHVYSQMVVSAAEGDVLITGGHAGAAIVGLEHAATACREKRFRDPLIDALRHLARAYVATGRPREGAAAVEEAIEREEQMKAYVNRTMMNATLAEARLALDDLDGAETALRTALEFAERNGERGQEGWAQLAGGRLALRRSDRSRAEEHVDAAQEIAEELGMMPLLERCRAVIRALR
jgi:tetratricopeptide (TPR) repeat protein